MNIAYFIPNIDQIGGAELGTRRLAEQVAQRGHEVTILTTQSISQWQKSCSVIDYTKKIRVFRLPVWQRSRRTFAHMLAAEALLALPLVLRHTQILHLRGLNPETQMLARIARHVGISTLCVPMASGVFGDVAMFPAETRKAAVAFDWVSGLTNSLRAEVIDWGIPTHRTGVIPNGVDIDRFKPPSSTIDAPRVIFVGQFRPEKRIQILLCAWRHVKNEYDNAQLTLVGGGHNIETYVQLATQFGISPTFIANTNTESVLAHLQNNAIFVMPGVSEGMSNALLEAMAVGLAPIIADTPANRAVVTPENDGLCYSAESPEALATQIKRLISDKDLRHQLGAAARKTVIQRFDLNLVTEQYLALYAQLLGE